MKIIFMGTAEFAVPSLSILLESGHTVAAVVTVPDKQQGRGQQVRYSPVKEFALQHNLPILQPEKLKDEQFIAEIRKLQPDLIVVVAFRILPKEVFTIPKFGSVNLHASLLPKFRGAAPINWAIIRGEKETGVTSFFLKEKVDEGNIILQARMPIGENETVGDLHDKLADVGAEIILHTVNLIEAGTVTPKPQNEADATTAPKIFKEHCKIDWSKPANEIHNMIRGFSPVPGAFTRHNGTTLKIFLSRVEGASLKQPAGTIVEANERILIATGKGNIEILELQREGKKRMKAKEFLLGYGLKVGERVE